MTQTSQLWDGQITGDAILAPYSAVAYREIFRRLLVSDEESYGVVSGGCVGQGLSITRIAQNKIRVGPGAAVIKGVVYINTGNVDITLQNPPQDFYCYSIVLRLSNATQQVRLLALGPLSGTSSNLNWPTLTQSEGNVWDVRVANVAVRANYIYGVYPVMNRVGSSGHGVPELRARRGGSATAWNTAGTTNYDLADDTKIQVGTIQWTGSASDNGSKVVTFPKAFDYSPIVFVEPTYCYWYCGSGCSGNGPRIPYIASTVVVTTTTATIYWRYYYNVASYGLTVVDFAWMAIGTRFES